MWGIEEYVEDPWANGILEGNLPNDEYKVEEELIQYKNRIFLVCNSRMKDKIIKEYHDNTLVGHQGYYKTYKKQ